MASIEKRGDVFRIEISQGVINGRRDRIRKIYKPDPKLTARQQRQAAERFAAELEEKIKNGYSLEGEKITFETFSERWLDNVVRPTLEIPTVSNYEMILNTKILPNIGHIKLSQIRPHTIEGLYQTIQKKGYVRNGERRQYSYVTLKRIQDILNGIFKYAQRLELIEKNPCDVIKPPRTGATERKIKCFSAEDISHFLQALEMDYPAQYKAHDRIDDTGKPYHVREYTEVFRLPLQMVVFYYVALFTGIRREENITLTWDDVDFENNTISITKATAKCTGGQYIKKPKTKSSNRVVNVLPEVMALLQRHKREQAKYKLSVGDYWQETLDENGKPLRFIYTQDNGKQMNIDTPSKRFVKLIKDYNRLTENEGDKLPEITLHGLRHTHATLLIANGVDIGSVSGRLGHADISTTLDVYTHYLTEKDKAASETMEQFLPKTSGIL